LRLAPTSEPGEVRQWTDVLIEERGKIVAALEVEQIASRNFWFPLHRQEPYRNVDAIFSNSIAVSERGLWLPSRLDMGEGAIDRICDVIVSTLRR